MGVEDVLSVLIFHIVVKRLHPGCTRYEEGMMIRVPVQCIKVQKGCHWGCEASYTPVQIYWLNMRILDNILSRYVPKRDYSSVSNVTVLSVAINLDLACSSTGPRLRKVCASLLS